jgi:hypothetical protein
VVFTALPDFLARMEVLLNCCCGLDVHKDKIEGCILKHAERLPSVKPLAAFQANWTDFANGSVSMSACTLPWRVDSAEKLCSWAGLVPHNDESAGIVKSRKILHGNPYVKSILVQCAWAAVKTRNSEFNRWFWARQGRLGRKKSIIAVARKILSCIYTLLQSGELYKAPNIAVIPMSS